MMKRLLCCLLLMGGFELALADVEIRYADATGQISTMIGRGDKVRIDGGPMSSYVLVDGASNTIYIVEEAQNLITRFVPGEMGEVAEAGQLNVSLKTRGGREKIAGHTTGRYDLLANGEFCGSVYGSSELIKNTELQRMFRAMQGMHQLARHTRSLVGDLVGECDRAEGRLIDLIDISGFVLRYVNHEGQQRFDVKSIDLNASVDPAQFELPSGMQVVDLDVKMKAMIQDAENTLQQMMEQMQQMQGGEGASPEMQLQMQEMMQQLQQLQQQAQ